MDAGAEGGASASRRDPRLRSDALCRGAGVLQVDVLWRDLHIVQGCLDVGVTHQLHQRGQADAGTHHIRSEGMPEAMGLASWMPVVPR